MQHSTDLLWLQPAWLRYVNRWIDEALQDQGIARQKETTQPHIRPWSTVLKIPTSAGDVYFKAVIPDLAYEAALTERLFAWLPHCVPHVLASDPHQGWLLMMDGSVRLRELLHTTDDLQHWEILLSQYATLQQESVNYVNELLDLGVCDRRLSRLPAQFEKLLNTPEFFNLDHSDGLTSEEYTQLQNSISHVAHLCEHLEAFHIPEALDHSDLHDGNVFILHENYRFFDWGDSGISHPFFSLHRTFGNLQERFDLDVNSDWCNRLKTAYMKSGCRLII